MPRIQDEQGEVRDRHSSEEAYAKDLLVTGARTAHK